MRLAIDIDQLHSYFTDKPVELVYLFGSLAEGKEKSTSDVDIAVLFSPNLSKQKRFDVKLSVISDMSMFLKTDKIDVVDLADASAFLKFEAIKNRKEIFARSESRRVTFEKRVLSEYFDRTYYIKRHIKQGIQKLREEYEYTTR